MKIAVIGAGAMGSLYGGYLKKAGHDVFLIDIWKEHIDKINSCGLRIIEGENEVMVYPKGVLTGDEAGVCDVAIIFVKSTTTALAVEKNAKAIGKDTLVVTLQNGYGNIDEIKKYVDEKNIAAGTTAHGATMIAPGVIKHAGIGATYIGSLNGTWDKRIEEFINSLKNAGFESYISSNVMELIWNKLIINVGINPLTAILRCKNGELLKSEEAMKILSMAVGEAVDTAEGFGIKFDKNEIVNRVFSVAEKTSENKSSMLQDVLNNRKTEIDMINGAVVREGRRHNIKTPINEILVSLIKAIEKSSM